MTARLCRAALSLVLLETALTASAHAGQAPVPRQPPPPRPPVVARREAQPLTPEQQQRRTERRAAAATARQAAAKEAAVHQRAFRDTFEQGKAAKLAAENQRVRAEIARLSREQ
jgi:hypothetical protein